MSRTYRRTDRKTPRWVSTDLKRIDGYAYWQRVPLQGKDRKIAINMYHSDGRWGNCSPPTWFVNMFFTRRERASQKRELKKLLLSNDYDEYEFNPYRKGAYYAWW